MAGGEQSLSCQCSVKTVTSGLVGVGSVKSPVWGHRDPPLNLSSETVGNTAEWRNQWRFCIRNLSLLYGYSAYYFAVNLAPLIVLFFEYIMVEVATKTGTLVQG